MINGGGETKNGSSMLFTEVKLPGTYSYIMNANGARWGIKEFQALWI